ncbi:MAG TPA: EAL domain-containing protein [Burkholderiaceae bacterium]|nr:EAL domain-containing protein [Burkholderiaceae bacterium]
MTDVVSAAPLLIDSRVAKILIVEDEAIVALDLAAQLEEMGYEVCGTADNGMDAIAYAWDMRPDLILMDIVIKGELDGVDIARHINNGMKIPVIFLTAYSDIQTVERAAATAPYGYLTKPFQARELRAAIEVALYKAALERRLRESERWFAATLRCVADGVIATDGKGRVRFMNPAAEKLLGWRREDAMGLDVADIVPLRDASTGELLPSPARRALETDSIAGIDYGTILESRNGNLPIDDSAAPIRGDDDTVLGAVMVFRDVRERMAAEEKLRQSEERFRSAFDFAPVGMALVGLDNRFLQVNDALCKLLEQSEQELVGADQAAFSHADDLGGERACLDELLMEQVVSAQFEKRYHTRSGAEVWTLVSVSLLRQHDAPLCFLFQIHDVTKRKEAEYRLAHLAHFDPMTGLVNRTALSDEIERQIVLARRHQHRLAIVFLDLDHFKQINDSLGHEAGDDLLKLVATRLKASVRESDTVGRLGGDEFVILLPEIHSAEEVLIVTDKVRAECAKPVRIAGQEISIGISLGVSLCPDDAQDVTTLLRYADSALYHAKAEGRNNLQFYRTELTAQMDQRMRLGNSLRLAIERGEFELYYQPIVSLADEKTLGSEALIRWHHPTRGLLAAEDFMPLAEEIGLSTQIGEWVIDEACRTAASWPADGHAALTVAVNVSARQFKISGLVQQVKEALARNGLAPERLCLEITERTLLENTDRNLAIVAELKAAGIQIAIDDFGIGYSSLSYIRRFDPTALKIDRSLIGNVAANPGDAAIVRAAIAMARSLKLGVITEGVETEAQKQFLENEGCDMAQGYFYAHPYPAGEFRTWLARPGSGRTP